MCWSSSWQQHAAAAGDAPAVTEPLAGVHGVHWPLGIIYCLSAKGQPVLWLRLLNSFRQ